MLDALGRLASTRPIFHAEADFQHALAWELRVDVERIRLELRPLPDEALFLDLLVHGLLGPIANELKYLTRAHRAEVDGDVLSRREQSAHDVRRYDVVGALLTAATYHQRAGEHQVLLDLGVVGPRR